MRGRHDRDLEPPPHPALPAPGAPRLARAASSRTGSPCPGRTIRRDVERLRGSAIRSSRSPGPAGGYRLRAGTAMPPLLLDDDEAIAIAVGLGTAARASVTGIEEAAVRALVKLEQVLPAHLRRRVRALQAATTTMPAGGPTVDPLHLTVHRRRLPRRRARPLRLPRARRRRVPARGRAARARQPRAPLVPRGLGPRAARTGARSASTASTRPAVDRRALPPARAAGRGRRGLRRPSS